ncbi:hypothetical protein TIFTF001_024038 [Ficus carica]|uniref:Uncharacterized protein n=1 Tax=Ficus carica TaxID=3494 RepID=A0AA88B0G3_FICCA|nr:hypothetical protein TIFTF001_024038 [Ficus carica]
MLMIIIYRHIMKIIVSCQISGPRVIPETPAGSHHRQFHHSQNTPRVEMSCPMLSHRETAKRRSNLTKLPLRCSRIYISTPLSYAVPMSVIIRRCIRCLHLDLSLTPLPFSSSLSLYSLSLSSVSLSPQPAQLGSFLSVSNRSRVAFQTPWVLFFFFHHSKLERVGSVSENAKDLLRRIGDFYGGGWWLRRESWRCLGTGIGTGRIGIGVGTGVGRIGIGIGIGIGIEEVHEGFGLVESMLCEGFGKENKVGLLVCDPEQG